MGRIQPVARTHVWYRQAVHVSPAPSVRVHARYMHGPASSPFLPSNPLALPTLVCGLSTSPALVPKNSLPTGTSTLPLVSPSPTPNPCP